MSTFQIIAFSMCVPLWAMTFVFFATSNYYNRQTMRILSRLPEQPKPWYVRLADKFLSRGRSK